MAAYDPATLPPRGLPRLRAVMAALRSEQGCPWDREQSLRSLQAYLIEESYEAVEAIDALGALADCRADERAEAAPAAIAAHREELGDVLLQVVFQAQIAEEMGLFDVEDVAQGIADKMIRRHPHVFADERADDTDAVVARWQQLKRAEGKGTFDGVPAALPALLRAERIGSKAARLGFDWPNVDGALGKVDEELAELREAIAAADPAAIEHELGDLLFATTSVARHAGVDAEGALRRTLLRFQERFALVEAALAARPSDAPTPDDATLDALWEQAKRKLAASADGAT